MGKCQKWDCVWHGTELSASAPWCEYCAMHTFYNIPDEPKIRGCEPGEGCDKYRPGKTFEYIDHKIINGKVYPWKRTFKRKPPTAKRLAKFLRQQKHMEHIKAVKEENERKMRERYARRPAPAEMQRLWEMGKSDAQIARELECMPDRVRAWRGENNLREGSKGKHTKFEPQVFERYYALGLDDGELALLLNVSKGTVQAYRQEAGLPANRPPVAREIKVSQ